MIVRTGVLCAVAMSVAACGDGATVSALLLAEASSMVSVRPPDGWDIARTSRLTGDYFVIEVNGVDVVAAGEFRDARSVRATTVAVAWESPVLDGDDAVAAACREVVGFAGRADDRAADVDVEDCVAASVDPDLRDGFVLSFADHVVATDEGTRSFGAGILLESVDGRPALRVVTSLSFALAPP